MSKNQLETLLLELHEEIPVELHVDVKDACTVLYENKIRLQMQMNKEETGLILLAYIDPLPPGKFREKVLHEALKCNSLYPKPGSLAYLEKTNELVSFALLPLDGLSGKKLYQQMIEILDFSLLWKQALEANMAAPAQFHHPKTKERPPFFKS